MTEPQISSPQTTKPAPRPRYFVAYPYPTCLLTAIPEGAVGVSTKEGTPLPPPNTSDLSPASYARSVVIPHYKALAAQVREGPDYVFYLGNERPANGVEVTPDALAVLADIPVFCELVGLVVGSLGMDAGVVPYRGGGSDLPPSSPYASAGGAEAWMGLHGYSLQGSAAFPGLFVYRLDVPTEGKSDFALLYVSGERRSKVGKGEPVRPEVLAFRDEHWSSGQLPPILCALPECPDFALDWAEASRHPRVFPVPVWALDLDRGDNVFFPRIFPAPAVSEELPEFHPGPALYSWRSAPWACDAMVFSGWRHFYIIRESHHSDPVERCPRDAYVIVQ